MTYEKFDIPIDASSFVLNGVQFLLDTTSTMGERRSTENAFVLGKTPELVLNLLRQLEGKPVQTIFDLGIFKGGSVVLYHELFRPRKLVAIENGSAREVALDAYVRSRQLESVIRPYYGTDQADRNALTQICATEFGDERIDLVIDDASHLYDETRASFDLLFPKLKPGGLYVIEDWGWSHWPGAYWQEPTGGLKDKTPLSNLIFEILMTCASSLESAIKNVRVTGSVVYVERGYGALPVDWSVSSAYLTRGKGWSPMV